MNDSSFAADANAARHGVSSIDRNSVQSDEALPNDRTVPLVDAHAPVIDDETPELAGEILGPFRLIEQIARGGMGLIFRARDLEVERDVAIKLLRKCHAGNSQLRQQLLSEARVTGRLQHPGILPIYGTGFTEDDRPYFAMKLVRGQTLAELLEERPAPAEDLPRLLKVFEQICQTVSYSHSCGVVHLDIKPSNIMVGRFGEAHLMDWGLARPALSNCPLPVPGADDDPMAAAARLSELITPNELAASIADGVIWGTPSYMAPEQALGRCTDVRSDVFGLGGILTEILTGRPPYVGTSLADLCYKATRADLDSALTTLADCDADSSLVRLAFACLSRSPDDRPASAMAVASELTLYLESLHQRAASDLARFFELSLDLFCIAGFDGYFRRVNSNFSRVLGFPERQLLTRPFMDFVHSADRARTLAAMSKLRKGHPVVRFRNRYLTIDGELRVFEWTAKSITTEGTIFAVARDVTREGLSEQSPSDEPADESALNLPHFGFDSSLSTDAVDSR